MPRILSFTSNDWGWWRTVTGSLDTLDKYLAIELTPEDLDLNNGRTVLFDPRARSPACAEAIDEAPKSTRWKLRPGSASASPGTTTPRRWGTTDAAIFFATDIHGSEVCWRKFLNAGTFHKADVLVMGGDMTGKAMVPIVSRTVGWDLRLQDQDYVLSTEDEVKAMEKRIADRGYYPIRLTRDEVAAWEADPALVDARFKAEMVGMVERWMALADERLKGTGIRCVVSPANDDIFELDPIIEAAELVDLGEGNTIELDGFTMVSTGWANPTPWNTFRELPEDRAPDADRRARSPTSPTRTARSSTSMRRRTARTSTTPPSSTPTCATCRAARRSCRSVRTRCATRSSSTGRSLSLHGHIHEGRGAVKIGATLAVNPGSTYEDGVLQAAIVDLDSKKGEVKRYLLING